MDSLSKPIKYLKGVGPVKAELLQKELNIFKIYDLLLYFPYKYADRSKFYKINEINLDLPYIQIIGEIDSFSTEGKYRNKRLRATFFDDTGKIELVWFQGIKWIQENLKKEVKYVIFGKPKIFSGKYSIIHPEIDIAAEENLKISSSLLPLYSSTEKLKTKGLNSKGFSKIFKNLIPSIEKEIDETLSPEIIYKLNLISRVKALINIHFPESPELLQKAQFRLKFEEFFFIQLQLIGQKIIKDRKKNGHKFEKVGEYLNKFYKEKLPFELTGAQKRVIKEIRQDVGSGRQMNRLIQGDVGSGKTLVALMNMLIALDNGFQACLMAPTEILATQHYKSLSVLLEGLNVRVELLTGSTKASERKGIHESLANGEINILIGTHALLEDVVQFKDLGLVVIDEQHRFGVAQRAKLWGKNINPPHVLVMTATPIPRTLAMTVYGDLDVSVIDELPPGRKPVKTVHRYEFSRLRVFGFMKEQINEGRQVYVVFPLIKESEALDLKNLEEGYEAISRAFPSDKYQISIVHGNMKSQDKEKEMQRFAEGKTQIMIATTVIEVGVDIPNASVMIIENAERFGLSQLHQLRGRVGRGASQSFCILLTSDKLSYEAKVRINTMVRTNDGFEIAEIDLKLRGPGDIQGTQQSGVLDLKIADISKDGNILQMARDLAFSVLEEDPVLSKDKNIAILNAVKALNKGKVNWSKIS